MIDPYILHIESSGELCHVTLSHGLHILSSKHTDVSRQHIGQLAILVKEVLQENNRTAPDLNLISLSSGPGSYTGLRVAFALAKGLVFGRETKIVVIPTYEALLYDRDLSRAIDGQPCNVVLHARKDEYILYAFDANKKLIDQQDVKYPELFNQVSDSQAIWVSDHPIDGLPEIKTGRRSSINLIQPAYIRWADQDFIPPSSISPIYYKPPYITQPKRKLI